MEVLISATEFYNHNIPNYTYSKHWINIFCMCGNINRKER